MKKWDAAVIGTVFTDIKGFSKSVYNPVGRNLGRVEITNGGVGRNVAENMANLGLNVGFVSSVDSGMLGEGVLTHLIDCGVDTQYVFQAQEAGMGLWLLINDHAGEQVGSVSQLPDPVYVEKLLDDTGDAIIKNADAIVLETDFSVDITLKTLSLAKKHDKKVYALPASMEMALQTPEIFPQFECFICNHIEAGKLFRADTEGINPDAMLEIAKQGMDAQKMRSLVVTMGATGAVYRDARNGACGFVPACKVDVVDTSGAGDAFFSGAASALIRGLPLEKAVKCGTQLAALTIQAVTCTCNRNRIKDAHILEA